MACHAAAWVCSLRSSQSHRQHVLGTRQAKAGAWETEIELWQGRFTGAPDYPALLAAREARWRAREAPANEACLRVLRSLVPADVKVSAPWARDARKSKKRRLCVATCSLERRGGVVPQAGGDRPSRAVERMEDGSPRTARSRVTAAPRAAIALVPVVVNRGAHSRGAHRARGGGVPRSPAAVRARAGKLAMTCRVRIVSLQNDESLTHTHALCAAAQIEADALVGRDAPRRHREAELPDGRRRAELQKPRRLRRTRGAARAVLSKTLTQVTDTPYSEVHHTAVNNGFACAAAAPRRTAARDLRRAAQPAVRARRAPQGRQGRVAHGARRARQGPRRARAAHARAWNS